MKTTHKRVFDAVATLGGGNFEKGLSLIEKQNADAVIGEFSPSLGINYVIVKGGRFMQAQVILHNDKIVKNVYNEQLTLEYHQEYNLDDSISDRVDRIKSLDFLAKGLPCSVYRDADWCDCTNNGISIRHDSLYLVDSNTETGVFTIDLLSKCVVIKKKTFGNSEYSYAEPVIFTNRSYMSGGNILFSSDCRFKHLTGCNYPVKIHDRQEV